MTILRFKKALRPSEHTDQCALVQWIRLAHPDVLYFAVPNGEFRNAETARKLKAEGVVAGVPDLMICEPRGAHHGLFVELKRDGAAPSSVKAHQVAFADELKVRGYRCETAFGFYAAKAIIEDYLAQFHKTP
jgi:hypothetical protein